MPIETNEQSNRWKTITANLSTPGNKKKKYDSVELKHFETLRVRLEQPLSDVQEIRNCFKVLLNNSTETVPKSVLDLNSSFDGAFNKKIRDLQGEIDGHLDSFKNMQLNPIVNIKNDIHKMSFEAYCNYVNGVLKTTKEKAEKIIQGANKHIDKLFGEICIHLFEFKDPLYDIIRGIQNAVNLDLYAYKELDKDCDQQLSALMASNKTPEEIKNSLAIIRQKLNLSLGSLEESVLLLSKLIANEEILDEVKDSLLVIRKKLEEHKTFVPDFLVSLLSEHIASVDLPKEIKARFEGILQNLAIFKNVKFVLLSLSESFSSVPAPLAEIIRTDSDMEKRIEAFQKHLATPEQATALQFYLKDYETRFSAFIDLNKSINNLSISIQERLDALNKLPKDTPYLKQVAKRYQGNLDTLMTWFETQKVDVGENLELYKSFNQALTELNTKLDQGELFDNYKAETLAKLKRIHAGFNDLASEDEQFLLCINESFKEQGLETLIEEHKEKVLEINGLIEKNIDSCDKSKKLDEILNFPDVNRLITTLYVPLALKIKEYSVASDVLLSNIKNAQLSQRSLDKLIEPRLESDAEYTMFIQNIIKKVFFLLENCEGPLFAEGLENLLQIVNANASASENIAEFENDRNAFSLILKLQLQKFLKKDRLEPFFSCPEQVEKICNYINKGLSRTKGKYYAKVNAYLDNINTEQLDRLAEAKPALKSTISRIRVTQWLSSLHEEYPNGDNIDGIGEDSLWKMCKSLEEFKSRKIRPLFSSIHEENWYALVEEVANRLVKTIGQLNNNGCQSNRLVSLFFLQPDLKGEKSKALNSLKEQIMTLPQHCNKEMLEANFEEWEKEFGKLIDKPRYRFYIILFMKIYHALKELIGEEVIQTKSRFLVQDLKSTLSSVVDTLQKKDSDAPDNEIDNSTPLFDQFTPQIRR